MWRMRTVLIRTKRARNRCKRGGNGEKISQSGNKRARASGCQSLAWKLIGIGETSRAAAKTLSSVDRTGLLPDWSTIYLGLPSPWCFRDFPVSNAVTLKSVIFHCLLSYQHSFQNQGQRDTLLYIPPKCASRRSLVFFSSLRL